MPKMQSVQDIKAQLIEGMKNKPKPSWSFSSLTVYEQCPYRWHLKYVEKLPEPKAPAMERGSQIHEAIEHYLIGDTAELTVETKVNDAIKTLKTMTTLGVEEDWGFTEDWQRTDWDQAWLRMKLDAYFTAPVFTIIDFKTGKSAYNEIKHTQQGQLYAVGASHLFPDIPEFRVEFWYLDEGKVHSFKVSKDQANRFKANFDKRARLIGSSKQPKPTKQNCRFCPYKQTEQCDYRIET